MKPITRNNTFIVLLLGLLIVFSFASLFLGRYYVEPEHVLKLLWSGLLGSPLDSVDKTVVLDIRLPRLFIVILVGAGLSVSGAAFQGCFHNPLVSPDVLGVSAGAGFGAALGILWTNGVTTGVTAAMAFAFGLLSVVVSLLLSRLKNESSILALVLSGIIVSAVFNALISLVKFVADTDSQLPAITFWLMGSFSNTTFEDLGKIIVPILVGIGVLIAVRWRINVLTLGDEEAKTLGINPGKTRMIIIAAATIITASSVVVAGIVGWVGLIIPNLCRMIVGSDHKYLMPASCLCGAVFLLTVDFIARVLTPSEIPIGILTAIIGAPFFALVYKKTEGC
ncbi:MULTISPECIES: FecCD family ABC transporter permease [unclassified Acetobacterium]|jgi:iron complex transport system permease protein|uniref:FecCD family ABC transporter permease n=1 Tax=unclassified Acetobacterium TaxID=2638182 RepID=UPI000DBEB20E|nr:MULTISPECIES: iron ABC transporter permease [unclassified Acetobacterium]AWW25795.1 iron ABC transporter permease [Acetobacterium sp. KB-1]MDZ5725843.1 iron ABC transporter permease [Acetobacterium sp. K1/6]